MKIVKNCSNHELAKAYKRKAGLLCGCILGYELIDGDRVWE